MAAAVLGAAAKEQYVYTQIAHNEGLTSTVNCIYKEKDGDVWIGTPSGLHSFNGYTLRHYDNQLFGGRKIHQIWPDRDNCIWIATDRSLIRRNPESESFEKISTGDSLVKQPFYSILPDNDGLWVGGLGRLYRYAYSDRKLKTFCMTADDFDFRNLAFMDSTTLLCTSNNGKLLINTTSGEISQAPIGDRSEVAATLIDSKGRIWM
jgi:ligand-binding sensor domain-containing protein